MYDGLPRPSRRRGAAETTGLPSKPSTALEGRRTEKRGGEDGKGRLTMGPGGGGLFGHRSVY